MIDPQFRSHLEKHSVATSQLQELQLLKPLSMDVTRGSVTQPSSQCKQGSSAYSMWKNPKSSYPDTSLEITHSSILSAKKKLPGELSCELGLGVWENARRVCRICQRHFSSGRALGGHMRVHGPLFQSAGSKRKLNPADLHGITSSFEERHRMDISDAKDRDSSLQSKSVSEKEVGKDEDGAEPIIDSFTESEGEAVEDVYEDDDNDGVDDYDMGVDRSNSISLDLAEVVDDGHLAATMAPSKRNPLYKLRHNPKRSRRFADDDLAMEMFLSEQGRNGSLERSRVCSECGKAFWSWKALFGHMRCHPEREWRGILRPEDSSVHNGRNRLGGKRPFSVSRFSESSGYELESDVENKEYNEESGAGRACVEKEEALQIVEEEEVVVEELAVMQTKIGDAGTDGDMCGEDSKERGSGDAGEDDWNPRWPPTGKRSRRKSADGKAESLQQMNSCAPHQEEPALTSESASLVELEEEHQVAEIPNFLFMLAEAARKIEQDTQVRENLGQRCPDMPYFTSKVMKKEEKHEGEASLAFNAKQSVAPANSTSGIAKYECSTCKKSFNSHQALGGHRASHRKMKGCFALTTLGDEMGFGEYDSAKDEFSLRASWQGNTQDKATSHLFDKEKKQQQQSTKGHECSVCHRMFLTGQALGGHKRCHYIGEKVAEAGSVTSSNKQLCEEGHSSKLDEGGSILDLNLPAPTDGDGEVACGSAELRLFNRGSNERKGTWTAQSNSGEMSLAPWNVLGGQKSSSWELEGSSWTIGPAVAC